MIQRRYIQERIVDEDLSEFHWKCPGFEVPVDFSYSENYIYCLVILFEMLEVRRSFKI